MTEMTEFLLECLRDEELVDYKTYFDPDITETGYVVQTSSSLICFSLIQDDGTFNVFSILRIKDLYFVRKGSPELKKINGKAKANENLPNLKKIDLSNLKNSLSSINQLYGYVVMHVEEIDPDVCYIGEVIKVGKFVTLEAFGSKNSSGRSIEILKLDDISRIDFEGKYEKDLHKNYKEKVIYLK